METQNKNTDFTDTKTQIQRHRLHRKSSSSVRHFSVSPLLLIIFFLLPFRTPSALEVPLEFHGYGFMGKYLNSDTIRYNMDASVEVFCTLLRHENFSFFIRYRDDLDMAEQKGGVALDPRYTHYYISGGVDYLTKNFLFTTYFMHDCIHDIDYDVSGTPVFNRLRFQIALADFHDSRRLRTSGKFLWSVNLGFYPHWQYHGWDINAGADYKYDVIVELFFKVFQKNYLGIALNPTFSIARGDTTFYNQHVVRLMSYYTNSKGRFGMSLDYNIFNNDPIKNPDKLWLLSIFVAF